MAAVELFELEAFARVADVISRIIERHHRLDLEERRFKFEQQKEFNRDLYRQAELLLQTRALDQRDQVIALMQKRLDEEKKKNEEDVRHKRERDGLGWPFEHFTARQHLDRLSSSPGARQGNVPLTVVYLRPQQKVDPRYRPSPNETLDWLKTGYGGSLIVYSLADFKGERRPGSLEGLTTQLASWLPKAPCVVLDLCDDDTTAIRLDVKIWGLDPGESGAMPVRGSSLRFDRSNLPKGRVPEDLLRCHIALLIDTIQFALPGNDRWPKGQHLVTHPDRLRYIRALMKHDPILGSYAALDFAAWTFERPEQATIDDIDLRSDLLDLAARDTALRGELPVSQAWFSRILRSRPIYEALQRSLAVQHQRALPVPDWSAGC